jgi:hypothetical protein
MGIGTLKTIASSFYTLVPESFWTHAHHEARRTEMSKLLFDRNCSNPNSPKKKTSHRFPL